MLAKLDEHARTDLLHRGRRVDHPADTVLIRLGERTTHVLVVLDGHVKVITYSDSGKTVLLALRSRGDLVGEIAGMDHSPRMATIETAGPVSTRVLTAREFHLFLDDHPTAGRAMSAYIGSKLRSATERILDYSSHNVADRLARVLLRLARDHGVPTPEGLSLNVRVSQPELASIISASEAALQKALTELRDKGVVTTGYRTLTVTDADELCRRAGLPPNSLAIPHL
ncbi:Crp/Fnr family transcriptional regulator [Nocardiopsis lambiniae]|uniref:Crp/Fnr family transcriptional regulator n=1 Tax=Nocardiopsis lambiniae TaxID=3075539 RepID=A0ABU2MGA3_9ACTN|nr:Crp/Fnr family transcriptional regulator [Nocardiopsis sp. DSM 44743]MDT0331726.1 Crp/Fnr family transcriptional regulator [Nocardiopsis sp. DSM 44743]